MNSYLFMFILNITFLLLLKIHLKLNTVKIIIIYLKLYTTCILITTNLIILVSCHTIFSIILEKNKHKEIHYKKAIKKRSENLNDKFQNNLNFKCGWEINKHF